MNIDGMIGEFGFENQASIYKERIPLTTMATHDPVFDCYYYMYLCIVSESFVWLAGWLAYLP